jgi:hypothetical protein
LIGDKNFDAEFRQNSLYGRDQDDIVGPQKFDHENFSAPTIANKGSASIETTDKSAATNETGDKSKPQPACHATAICPKSRGRPCRGRLAWGKMSRKFVTDRQIRLMPPVAVSIS